MIVQLSVIILLVFCCVMMLSLYCDLLDEAKYLYLQHEYTYDKIVYLRYVFYLILLFLLVILANQYLWSIIDFIFGIYLNNILMTIGVIIYCLTVSSMFY